MNKLEFINGLGSRLDPIPREEIQTILDYYVESVSDRMEDGMTEEEAIDSFGDLDQLAADILVEQGYLAPPPAPVPELTEEEKQQALPNILPAAEPKKKLPWWAIVLLVIGSPVWLSVGIAGAVLSFFVPFSPDTFAIRLLFCGACLVLAGVGVLLVPVCRAADAGFARLHRSIWNRVRGRKEAGA